VAHLVFNASELLAAWCASRIPHVGEGDFGPCQAIGIAAGPGLVAELYAVAVFHDWQEGSRTIQVSMAARSPKWATAGTLRALLHYAFVQLHASKLWVAIPHDNARAIRFNKGIGMKQEAILREHFALRRHAVILSMLRREYLASKWFKPDQKEAA
jgi:RimJ/RimL family protein N-acetyltransferase